jgi:serine/threonine-protein kinase
MPPGPASPAELSPPPPVEPDQGLRTGEVIAEKYRIEQVLGEGGMGIVYAATNVLTSKRVAIKWMLPKAAQDELSVQRFMREARAAGRVHHPNVVDVYDVGREAGVPFLVMELMRGEPASAMIGDKALPPAFVVDLLMPAMRGIHAAHELGVIHRDLKPENIFVCRGEDGGVESSKVLDFGISKALCEDEELRGITKTGAVMGTPHYMSPEQVRGRSDIDRRVDVYALGVILYEALTGSPPFDAETFTALAVEIATATPKSLRTHVPSLDPALDDAVLRALARDRDERFPDVAELARAIEPFGTTVFDGRRVSLPSGALRHQRETEQTVDASTADADGDALRSTRPVAIAVTDGGTPSGERAEGVRRLPVVAIAIVAGVVLLAGLAYAVLRGGEDPIPEPPAPQADTRSSRVVEAPEIAPTPAPPVEAPDEAATPEDEIEASVADVPDGVEPPPELAPPGAGARRGGGGHAGRANRAGESAAPPSAHDRAGGIRTSGVSVDDF